MELSGCYPMQALYIQSVTHQFRQCFWGDAEAGVVARGAPDVSVQEFGLKWPNIRSEIGGRLHDPAGCHLGLTDVLRSLFGAQRPGDVAAVANRVISSHKGILSLPWNWL